MNPPGPAALPAAPLHGDGTRLKPSAFWLLLLAAWAARVAAGLLGDQLLHPDEIYQYLEPAHGVVFGAQIYSWEFIIGARSWIIPGFVAGVLHAFDLAGLGDPVHYIPGVKVAFCTLSLILPASMYFLGRNLFGEATGRLAFAIGCFWYEFVGFAHKPLSDMVSCYFAIAAMALASGRRGVAAPALSGAAMMLAFSVRYPVGTLMAPFALVAFAAFNPAQRIAFLSATGAGLAGAVLLDHLTWGGFLHSLVLHVEQNIRFPWKIRVPFHAYYLWAGLASAGLFWAAVLWSLKEWRRYWPALALLAVFFVSHQSFVHKEYRFFFPWIPVWLVVAADLARRVQQSQWLKRLRPGAAACAAAAPFALVSIAGISNALPLQKDLYKPNLTEYEEEGYRFLHRDPQLQRYIDLGENDAVEGVFELSRNWPLTGGYYYLHRQIPLYTWQSLRYIQTSSGGKTGLEELATHILTPENMGPVESSESYELVESKAGTSLWQIRPEAKKPVRKLRKYRYTHVQYWIVHPWGARHINDPDDLLPRLAE